MATISSWDSLKRLNWCCTASKLFPVKGDQNRIGVRSETSEGTSTSAWPQPSRTGSSASSSPPPGAPQAARPRPAAPAPRPVRSERREDAGTDRCDLGWTPRERAGRGTGDGTGGEPADDALLG